MGGGHGKAAAAKAEKAREKRRAAAAADGKTSEDDREAAAGARGSGSGSGGGGAPPGGAPEDAFGPVLQEHSPAFSPLVSSWRQPPAKPVVYSTAADGVWGPCAWGGDAHARRDLGSSRSPRLARLTTLHPARSRRRR